MLINFISRSFSFFFSLRNPSNTYLYIYIFSNMKHNVRYRYIMKIYDIIAAKKKNSPASYRILLVTKKLFVIGPFYTINALRAGVKRTDRGLK